MVDFEMIGKFEKIYAQGAGRTRTRDTKKNYGSCAQFLDFWR